MNQSSFTPEESLALITELIQDARTRFEQSGYVYIFWGTLLSLIGGVHFAFIRLELYQWIFAPYLAIPVAAFLNGWWQSRRVTPKVRKNAVYTIVARLWLILGANMSLLGFFFFPILENNLIPVILILQSVGIFLSGVALGKNYMIYLGLLANGMAIAGFWLSWDLQPLLMSATAVVSALVPGIILQRENKAKELSS